jgi:hypothetical protein
MNTLLWIVNVIKRERSQNESCSTWSMANMRQNIRPYI